MIFFSIEEGTGTSFSLQEGRIHSKLSNGEVANYRNGVYNRNNND